MSSPFMQLYIGDYLRDTMHLSTEGHGAYLLILFAMWNADGWVSAEPKMLARYARMTPSKWAKVQGDVMPLLQVEDGLCTQKRLRIELEKASGKSLERSKAGKLGAQAKALKSHNATQAKATANAQANVDAMVKHSPETRNQRPETKEEDTSSLRSEVVAPKPIPESPAFELVATTDPELPASLDRSDEHRAFEAYNVTAEAMDWPKAQRLSDSRRRGLRMRLRECGGLAGWTDAMAKARASPFLSGSVPRSKGFENWTPDLDFFLQASSFTKLMEGRFDERSGNAGDGLSSAIFQGAASAIARRRRADAAGAAMEAEADFDRGASSLASG